MRARRDLERAAKEWDKAGRPGSALRTGKLLKRYRSAAFPRTAQAREYLGACGKRVLLQRIGQVGFALTAAFALGILAHVSGNQYPPTLAAKGLLVEIGIRDVQVPAMGPVEPDSFQMGDLQGDGRSSEQPVHDVRIVHRFEIGVYEVTFDDYDLFAAATGRRKPNDEGWGRGNRPVIGVSWEDASTYADWLARKTGKQFRLPTEAEWEYAARAGTKTGRFWKESPGAAPDPACTFANVFDQANVSRIKSRYTGIDWEPFACSPSTSASPAGSLPRPSATGSFIMPS